MGSYRIVLADDHTMFREGLKKILEQKGDIEVIGEVGDGVALLNLLKEVTPDMIILDISMPNLGGIEATEEIKLMNSSFKVLILSMHNDREFLSQAISAGVDGYLLKNSAGNELFSAIDTILGGKVYISPSLLEDLPDDFINRCRTSYQSYSNSLTLREREVIKLIAEGKTSKESADLLYISPRTVEKHRLNIMIKLNIRNIPDLVKYAILKGYTSSNH